MQRAYFDLELQRLFTSIYRMGCAAAASTVPTAAASLHDLHRRPSVPRARRFSGRQAFVRVAASVRRFSPPPQIGVVRHRHPKLHELLEEGILGLLHVLSQNNLPCHIFVLHVLSEYLRVSRNPNVPKDEQSHETLRIDE
ncbi:hypothetical protein ACQJBY_031824 [Aegilops geniculata]